jgi:thiosulfate reductase cytochrome b subunit
MKPATAEDANPLWLRLWHGTQALLFFGLIATGLSMHYAGSAWAVIPFSLSVQVHNACGIATAVLWIVFVFYNAASGHMRHYIPKDLHIIHSAVIQLRYYVLGMFRGDAPPVTPGLRNNPAQQLSYAVVMYVLMPLAVGSGVLLLFPILAPERALGRAGLWPMALLHLSVGYLLTLFLVVHIYLATTGETFFSLTREMITGSRASSRTSESEHA